MAEAKRRGQHVRRRFKLCKRRIQNAHYMITEEGMELADVAEHYSVSPVTIIRGFKRHGLETEKI